MIFLNFSYFVLALLAFRGFPPWGCRSFWAAGPSTTARSSHQYPNNATLQSSTASSLPPIRLVIVLHFPPFAFIIVLTNLVGASFDSLTGYWFWAADTLVTTIQTSGIALTHTCQLAGNFDRYSPIPLSAQRMSHA